MANITTKKGVIGILTGGGDVPGLNPAIRAVTIRALREGYQVVGLRRGWLGAITILRDAHADNEVLEGEPVPSSGLHVRDNADVLVVEEKVVREGVGVGFLVISLSLVGSLSRLYYRERLLHGSK